MTNMMTAPDGAYTIGGGMWNFGQTMTEDLARAAFEFPLPNLGNMIELLQTILAQLPLEALMPFKDFLGLADADFQSISQAVQAIINSLQQRPIFVTLKELVEAITGIIDGDWTDLITWFSDLGIQLQDFASSIAGLQKMVQDLIDGIWETITGGTVTLPKSVAELIAALANWLKTAFKPLENGFNALNKLVQDIIDAIGSLFAGSDLIGITLSKMVEAIKGWLDGPFTQLHNLVQQIIDAITGIWNPSAGTGNPIQGVIDAITGIFGVANSANTAASQAFARIESIIAGMEGGYSDTFDVPQSTTMPAGWQKKNTTADSYGPNGKGDVVGYMSGMNYGIVWYVQTTKPVASADMKVTAVLSRTPWWTTGIGAVQSPWYLAVQANSTNQECYRVKISNDKAQFQKVAAGGTVSALGTVQTIPINATGTPYSLQIKAGVLTLFRGGVAVATHSAVTDLVGRCAGFGGEKVNYVNLLDNPLAQFAGIAWQPA